MPRSLNFIVLACAGAILMLGVAGGSAASPNEMCTTSGPNICVDIVGNPATVPPSEPDEPPHFVLYSAQVVNDGPQASTHVTADLELSGGLRLVSATPSVGSCSVDGNPTCTLGRLAGGGTVTIEFVAQVPEFEADASATLTASFDETANDGPIADPKQDTVSSTENTTIEDLEGTAASFVPQGASASLTTDPTGTGVATPSDPLIGGAVITDSPISVTALIDEVALSLSCPRKVICPSGDWFHADIPGTFDPPLAFPLRWDGSLFSSPPSPRKFSLVYTACLDGCKLEIISNRCSSPAPAASELPCLTGVAKLDGDIVATLISDHNGWMK
jgi:Domain of unknown function DUF11